MFFFKPEYQNGGICPPSKILPLDLSPLLDYKYTAKMISTEEINLQRLLLSCENKLKEGPLDVWSPSEKRKFATYIKHLITLQRSLGSNITQYSERINQLHKVVDTYTMYVDVEKGVPELKLVKKKHLDELNQLEIQEPEWLIELKQQKDEEKKMEPTGEAMPEKNDRELKVNETNAGIRLRNPSNTANETAKVENVLQHHRQMHDELTSDLGRMARQLKINSQSFGDTLSKDNVILEEAQKAVESNLERMTMERKRLDIHHSKSWGTSFMSMGIILFVCIMFVLVFFTIKLLPKAT
ncbi:vesicle transport protein [Pilobolus umbonatus]|nr:vesicle transport protein [Pilobolus umbonatus]